MKIKIAVALILLVAGANLAFAQTTEFAYQGRLVDGTLPANAGYDFEFRLFDVETGGTALGTLTRLGIPVSSGIFTVRLDFGVQFTGANRWLEIAVRPGGSPGGFQQLLPRQPVTSSPYAVRSLNSANADNAINATNATNATNSVNAATATNALQLGGVAANQYVVTTDPRMIDARNPLPNSGSYIQNGTAAQAASSFNISGTGTANQINSLTDYRINGLRAFAAQGFNLFAGLGAGTANTGLRVSFFGRDAGLNNSTGDDNSMFGYRAGASNINGSNNAYFGAAADEDDMNGIENSYFGGVAGGNANGSQNSFFGYGAGNAGIFGTPLTGSGNTFIGYDGGADPGISVNNTALGSSTVMGQGLAFATAIGAGSSAALSNSVYLGRANGADTVRIPGATIIDGSLVVKTMGSSSGAVDLCINSADRLSLCPASSLRYKSNIKPSEFGLDLVKQLKPVTFDWIDGGIQDFGLVAEEVAAVEPLLAVFRKGQVEGVKYDRIGVVLINAVKEQQAQIDEQRKQIDALKKLICSQNPQAEVCKEEQK